MTGMPEYHSVRLAGSSAGGSTKSLIACGSGELLRVRGGKHLETLGLTGVGGNAASRAVILQPVLAVRSYNVVFMLALHNLALHQ